LPGDGVPHLAGGVVADEADRIDLLPGGTGGNQEAFAAKPLRGERRQRLLEDHLNVLQLPLPFPAAGEHAAGRGDEQVAVFSQARLVVAVDGILVHVHVHGGGDQHGCLGRQHGGGKQVIGDAGGDLADEVGGGRGDQEQIGPVRQGDVPDLLLGNQVEKLQVDRLPGEGLEGERRHEFGGGARHHDVHHGTCL